MASGAQPGAGAPPEMPLAPGSAVGADLVIDRYVGRSEAGLAYRARHVEWGDVVLKALAPGPAAHVGALRGELEGLCALSHPSLQRVHPMVEAEGRVWYVGEFVEGRTLRSAIDALARDGGEFGFRPAYNVLGHLVAALDALHSVTPHGLLTSRNVFIGADGRVRIINPGHARLALAALGEAGALVDDVAVAPEVRGDPWAVSEVSDYYALGIIAVELFTGQQPTATALPHLIDALEERFVPELGTLLRGLVAEEPGMRIASSAELHTDLSTLLRTVRRAGRTGERLPGPEDLPDATDAGVQEPEGLGELFEGIELPEAPGGGGTTRGGGGRWILQRGGRDYGPYTEEQVLQQLRADEVDEHTALLDARTREVCDLGEHPVFADEVRAYVPVREARREAERERREELQRRAKRAGVTTFVSLFVIGPLFLVAVVAWLVFGLGQGAYLFVTAEPYPFASVIRSFPYTFQVDAPEYETISADPDLLASLRDFSEPLPATPRRRGRTAAAGGDAAEAADEVVEDFVLNFDASLPARRLTQDEINGTLRASLGAFQRCFEPELRQNPSFRGATLNFSIHPNGRPFNVSVEGTRISASLDTCLNSAVRRLRFPQYNDVPMSVRYPFVLR